MLIKQFLHIEGGTTEKPVGKMEMQYPWEHIPNSELLEEGISLRGLRSDSPALGHRKKNTPV